MEAEKENMQSGFKPLRGFALLRRHRPENDMIIESFMREESPNPGFQQPLLKQNRSVEKTVNRRELHPTNVQDTNSVQNEEEREIGQGILGNIQPRILISNYSRRRSAQADISLEPKSMSSGDSLQIDEQSLHNPFRRLGHRRRSSVLNTHEDTSSENSAFAPNAAALPNSFQPNLRRRSKQLLHNLEELPHRQENFSSQQTNLEIKDFNNRRRSARLMQLDNISEKCESSSYLGSDKKQTENVMKEKQGRLEEKESYNRLATSQYSKNLKLIGSNSKVTRPLASPHVASSSASKGTFVFGGKKEAFEKVRHVIEKAREQRKISLLQSNSKPTPRAKLTPLRLNQFSARRRGQLMSSKRKHEGITTSSENKEEKSDHLKLSKECRRTLQFESGDEGDDSDDATAPLDMMDITNMISGSSILQCAEEQVKQSKPPAIKKNLMQISTLGIKRQHQITFQKTTAQEARNSKDEISDGQDEFRCAGDFESEWSQDEDKLVLQKNAKHDAISKRKHNDTLGTNKKNICDTPEEEPKIVKFTEEKPVSKVSKLKTPTYKVAQKSSRTVNPSGVRPVIGRPLQRNQPPKDTKTKSQGRTPNTRRRSKGLKSAPLVVQQPRSQTVEVQTSPMGVKCDASTNTQIKFAYGRSLDPTLKNELETLSKEQDEIAKEAQLIRERTAARQKRMREDGILDSFAATISPLKKLKAMMQEKEAIVHSTQKDCDSPDMGYQSQINKSVQFSETSIFYEAPEIDDQLEDYETPDTSMQKCNSLNASWSHWHSLKDTNRFLQTPLSKKESTQPVQEEKMEELPPPSDNTPGEKSPFTELAGDCQRPSLDPLTPHSRKEVSLLKLSLRKQLEQLYD